MFLAASFMVHKEKKMHYGKEKIGLSIILVWFASFFAMTFGMRAEVRVWPQFVEGMGAILTLIELANVIYKEKHGIKLSTPAPMNKEILLVVLLSFASFIAYVFLAKRVGFITMTFVFSTLFTYWQFKGMKKWKYPLISAIIALVIWFIFEYLLAIPLPKGILI